MKRKSIVSVPITPGIFFLIFMSLDFFTTTWVAQGDVSMEGNVIAALWWKIMGPFHHIDVPIWIGYIFLMAWIFNMKSEFIALCWLNGIAFGHFLGWSTWLPNGSVDYLYDIPRILLTDRWVYYIPLGAFGMFFGLLLAYVQVKGRQWWIEFRSHVHQLHGS